MQRALMWLNLYGCEAVRHKSKDETVVKQKKKLWSQSGVAIFKHFSLNFQFFLSSILTHLTIIMKLNSVQEPCAKYLSLKDRQRHLFSKTWH